MSKKFNDMISNGSFGRDAPTKLSKNSFANFLEVVNKGSESYFNLCKGISFKFDSMNPDMYYDYIVLEDDCWTNISYKNYNTPELWWLICKFNDVKNPFTELEAGKIIKIPSVELKDWILDMIQVN